MDIDNLKDIWKEDKIAKTPDISTEKQSEIHNPLQKIRQNMRMEFWMTIVTLIPVVVYIYFSIDNLKLKTYTFTLIFVMLCVVGFYYKKFFLLYKELGNNAINTKDALKDLLYQFNLNKQYYISYYLAFAPFLVCEMILLNEFKYLTTPLRNEPQHLRDISASLLFIISTIFGLFFLYVVGKFWFQHYYGKYIDKIVVLNSEISGGFEDELKLIQKRENSLFSRLERFLTSKMGNAGTYVTMFIWLFLFLVLVFILIIVIGIVVGFAIAHFSK